MIDTNSIITVVGLINAGLAGICFYLAEHRYKLSRKADKLSARAHMNELMANAYRDMAKAEIEKNECLKEEKAELKASLYEAHQALRCEEKHRKIAEDILKKGEIA